MIKLSFGSRDVFVSKMKVRTALTFFWVAMLGAAGFLVYLGAASIDQARDRMTEQATSYAHLLAEHDRFGFTLADVILKDMSEHLTADDFTGTMTPERRSQVLGLLTRHRERLPGIASFTLIGPDGIRRIGVVGKDFTDLSKRPYFIALREGREFFITDVEDGVASGKPGIHVARRFAASDGHFAGVIVMNLAAQDVFFSFYHSMSLGKGVTTTLRDPQRFLITYPRYTLSAPPTKTQDAVGEQIAAGRDHGVVMMTDPSDGLVKVTAFEKLEGTNIFATAALPTDEPLAESRTLALAAIVAAVACIFGAWGAHVAIGRTHALTKARDEAITAGAERKMLIRKLNTVVEDERKAISTEIHDVLNAMLIRVRFDSQGILALLPQASPAAVVSEIAQRAESITKNANDLYAQARGLVTRLRPEILDVLGLEQAIDEMVTNYNAGNSGCHFSFQSSGDMEALHGDVSIAAYRLVQEALSNVVRHSKATEASVSLKLNDDQRSLDIVIADDGVGFDSSNVTLGVGVVGMRERIAALNGQLTIKSCVNTGTKIDASIPLDDGALNEQSASASHGK